MSPLRWRNWSAVEGKFPMSGTGIAPLRSVSSGGAGAA
jgi:hypothetical protein